MQSWPLTSRSSLGVCQAGADRQNWVLKYAAQLLLQVKRPFVIPLEHWWQLVNFVLLPV